MEEDKGELEERGGRNAIGMILWRVEIDRESVEESMI